MVELKQCSECIIDEWSGSCSWRAGQLAAIISNDAMMELSRLQLANNERVNTISSDRARSVAIGLLFIAAPNPALMLSFSP